MKKNRHFQNDLSRKAFLKQTARWGIAGLMAALGLFNILKRSRLEKNGGCVELDTCSGCVKYQGCEKPEKV